MMYDEYPEAESGPNPVIDLENLTLSHEPVSEYDGLGGLLNTVNEPEPFPERMPYINGSTGSDLYSGTV